MCQIKIIVATQIFQWAMRRWTEKSKFLAHYETIFDQ